MNLAIDEALLDAAEADAEASSDREVLRLWSFDRPVVVVGRATKVEEEVNLPFCQQAQIPILSALQRRYIGYRRAGMPSSR
ncbi:MAG: hypothetical protein R3C05_08050 [Pirellulaceae bacterium]